MTPAQAHINLQLLSKTGMFATRTFGTPGAHGAGITGIHGIGVRTPIAAEVAAATDGFAIDMHIPNGGTFTMGLLSMMVATGVPVVTRFTGSTPKDDGATPKLHISVAPEQISIAITFLLTWIGRPPACFARAGCPGAVDNGLVV